jgi:hypothetical protein
VSILAIAVVVVIAISINYSTTYLKNKKYTERGVLERIVCSRE